LVILKISKVARLLQPHCNEIVIRRYVKFDENILACKPNLVIVPSSSCEPSSMFVPYFVHILVSSSDDDREDENPPLPAHLPPYESIELEPTPTPSLPRWGLKSSTREVVGDLVSDPSNQHQTHS
jgi:hypothetical protein